MKKAVMRKVVQEGMEENDTIEELRNETTMTKATETTESDTKMNMNQHYEKINQTAETDAVEETPADRSTQSEKSRKRVILEKIEREGEYVTKEPRDKITKIERDDEPSFDEIPLVIDETVSIEPIEDFPVDLSTKEEKTKNAEDDVLGSTRLFPCE